VYQKIGILAVLASVLLSAALLATPSFKVANAQGNETQGGQTMGVNVDQWIKALKQDNPTLAGVEQDPKVKDVIAKIKGMQDPKEATKNLDALSTLQKLMILKSLQEGQ
jgi:hypothetical protein